MSVTQAADVVALLAYLVEQKGREFTLIVVERWITEIAKETGTVNEGLLKAAKDFVDFWDENGADMGADAVTEGLDRLQMS